MNIEQQIIDNKNLIKDLNTRISNLLKQKRDIENELSTIPDTEQNKKRRDILKARINMTQKSIGNVLNNKKNIRNLIYNLERKQTLVNQQQTPDKISSFLQKGVPTDEDVMDEYEKLIAEQNNIDEEKEDFDEEKQDFDEEKEDFDEEKQDLDEEKQDLDEEKQDLDEEKEDFDEEKQDLDELPVIPTSPPISQPSIPITQTSPSQTKDMKTRKNRNIFGNIQMMSFPKSKINKTRKNGSLGFTETLKNPKKQPVDSIKVNPTVCQTIFLNSSNINKKYFYPSEFPKLTKIKPLKTTISVKKGGKKIKSRKFKKKI